MKDELLKCFFYYDNMDSELNRFSVWVLNSGKPKFSNPIRPLSQDVEECLNEILSVLLIHPDADYFCYDNKGDISYKFRTSVSNFVERNDERSYNSLRIYEDKIRIFLRDIKLEKLLN
jgi:hypothetical protein